MLSMFYSPSGQTVQQTVQIGGYRPLPAPGSLYYPRGSTFHAAAEDTLWWLFVGPHGRWMFAAVNGASAVSQLRRALQQRYWSQNNARLPSGRTLGQLYDPEMPKVDRPMLLRMAYALRESIRAREGFPFATEQAANLLEQDALAGRVSNDAALLILLMQYHMTGSQTIFPLSVGPGQRFYLYSTIASWKPQFDTPVLPSANWEARPIVAELDQLPLSNIAAIDSKRFEMVSSNGTRTSPQLTPTSTPPGPSAPPGTTGAGSTGATTVTTSTIVTGTPADPPARVIEVTNPLPTTVTTPGAFSTTQPPPQQQFGPIEIIGKPTDTSGTSTAGGAGAGTTTGGGTTGGGTTTTSGTGGGAAGGSTAGGSQGANAGALAGSVVGALSPATMAMIVVAIVAALGAVAFITLREAKGAS